MTLRLVALMSVVLLISLAAVGLLVNHFQGQFMEEVQSTASQVGRAALSTLEWTAGEKVELAKSQVPPRVVEERSGETRRRIKHIITTSTEGDELTVHEQLVYPAGAFPEVLPGEHLEAGFEACLLGRVQGLPEEKQRVFINLSAIRAETDPSHGLVLKIPKFTPDEGGGKGDAADASGGERYAFGPIQGEAGADIFLTRLDEIELPIRGNYQELFATLRNRSLFLFMGVFVVGMVLSTGLATRFTRPVRKLDAAIRRLSEGDLDVEVAVHGKGEIGRLSRAFNDMAGKLRTNRERERELVRREKLSALGRLAAGVAHDVRNPLHSIGLTLQHLSEAARPGGSEPQAEFDHSIETIRGEIRRLDQLVGNFLRFAKSERHERQPLDLGELLRDTVRLVRKESEQRGVRVDLAVADGLPSVPADAEAIRSSVLNLILNSFEAMPDGGTLTLDLSGGDRELVLEVADTGEGISEEERGHVFDFAYTTRETGNGLGLAMVHHCVVEEHGGRVSLRSHPGEGTRVRLTLPAGEEASS